MEPVEFRDMEYVMAVHEEQSFSGAARKHFISQPVLSRVVRKVERNLGVTLFDRSSIPLKPTPQGQKVLEYFEQMQKLRMELEQYCETAGQQGGPGLTVAAPSFFCTYGLPPVIAAFKERYPDWEIRLVEANDRDLVDFLRAGVAELGISANGDTAPDMESEVLRTETIILAVPAGFAVNRGLEAYALDPARGNDVPGLPLERFAGERFLFMKPGNDMRERGMRLCREAGFSPRIVMELDHVATSLSGFTGAKIDPEENLILTPGTQGALFLAMGANIMPGDKVAIVEPDYFANRKMVEFFGGQMVPVVLEYENEGGRAGISLGSLEEAFKDGVKLFLFSNPNNPVGCVYSYEEITGIAALAKKYGVTLIVDELYSRQVYPGIPYTRLCAQKEIPENLITIQGPSKTESLSGFRLGAAFGTAEIIERIEKLQAIMALRCSGYNQAVFLTWFNEPEGWLEARIRAHKEIRDAVMEVIRDVPGVSAKPTEGGSYLFVTIPELDVSLHQFIRIARELADVIVTPGTEFGPQYVHQFCINFSQDKENAAAAMKRLFAVMERYRKQ